MSNQENKCERCNGRGYIFKSVGLPNDPDRESWDEVCPDCQGVTEHTADVPESWLKSLLDPNNPWRMVGTKSKPGGYENKEFVCDKCGYVYLCSCAYDLYCQGNDFGDCLLIK